MIVKTSRRFMALSLAATLVCSATPMAAAQPISPDRLREATSTLTDWFKDLLSDLGELVDAEHRRRLIERLDDLKKAIFNLEQNKRDLVQALRSRTLTAVELDRMTTDLEKEINSARTAVREAGLAMREQFRLGGDKAERELQMSVGDRKNWILDLRRDLPLDAQEAEFYAKSGELVVEALREANQSLIVLIDKLEETETSP